MKKNPSNTPPVAAKEAFKNTIHNDTIIDEYHWLRDENWPEVKNKKIIEYLEAENKYTADFLKPHAQLQQQIFNELKEKIIENDETYPEQLDNYFYYTKTLKGQDHEIYCRKKEKLTASEEILLDANDLAKNSPSFSMGEFSVNPKHTLLAYSVDFYGEERYTIKVKNLSTNRLLVDEIHDTIGNIVWHQSMDGFFYLKLDENWRTKEIFFHRLGTKQEDDQLIYTKSFESFHLNIKKSADKKYLFIDAGTGIGNEIHYLDIKNNQLDEPILLLKHKKDLSYKIDHRQGQFYIKINDQGKNYRLVKVNVQDFHDQKKWVEIIPYNENVYLRGFHLTSELLLINRSIDGINIPLVIDNHGNKKEINFSEDAHYTYAYFSDYNAKFIRIVYTSLVTPETTLEYDFSTNTKHVRKVEEIPGVYNQDEYQTERLYAKAEDNTLIPISLVYKKSKFKKDGTNPLYLYGYGSYGHGIPTYFHSRNLPLLDRGVVFAIAHIRGGDELGFNWYESAKFLNKKLTFTDFITCAKHLLAQKYTCTTKLVAFGASAGGMLMGVIANHYPDLFKAIIALVPFVDTLNTMLDSSLPLTPGEYDEWGNPQQKEYYDYIKSYSPYDNIKKQDYPAIFAAGGLKDPRVAYWEPAKWIAKLRQFNTSNNPIILHTEMESGHKGKNGRYKSLHEIARIYAFIFTLL